MFLKSFGTAGELFIHKHPDTEYVCTMKYNNKRVLTAIFALALLSFSYVKHENLALPNQSPGKSDRKAIQIAKEVMKAMGGQPSWDSTHYVSWNFFGSRKLLWDKWGGIVRIDWLKKSRNIIVNLNDGTGKVQLDGVQQTHPDSLAKYLKMGKEVWINDSYWVFMPFKLLDPGVTLKYLGRNKTEDGLEADLIQLTFNNVGVTPENKYKIWVDKTSRLERDRDRAVAGLKVDRYDDHVRSRRSDRAHLVE